MVFHSTIILPLIDNPIKFDIFKKEHFLMQYRSFLKHCPQCFLRLQHPIEMGNKNIAILVL